MHTARARVVHLQRSTQQTRVLAQRTDDAGTGRRAAEVRRCVHRARVVGSPGAPWCGGESGRSFLRAHRSTRLVSHEQGFAEGLEGML